MYGAAVARRIVEFFTGARRAYATKVFSELTDRECEVLELVAAGLGNQEIARRLVSRVSQFLLIMSRRRPRLRGRPGFLAGWPAQGMGREIWRR